MNIKSEKGDNDMKNGRLDKNDLLKKFNTEELIEYLNGIIDDEIKKQDGMDSDMINECVDWILELKEVKIELTEDEIKRRVNSITKKRYNPKKRQLRFIYVAAIIVVMVFSVQIISFTAFSFDLFDWTKNTFLTLIGVEVKQDDISSISSHSRDYKTIDELELVENLDIIMPDWLPGNIEIKFISYDYNFEEKQVDIYYNDDITLLIIKLDNPLPETDGTKIYENNNILYYIFTEANLILWEYDENFYNLNCGFDVTEYAEKIIKNIK